MKVYFLGTKGWYDTETGNTICTLVDTKSCYILLDAGNGIHKIDKYIKEDKPVHLFLSHFHLDHIIGLHILLKFKFKSLSIYGQPGTKKILNNFLSKKFSAPFSMLPCSHKIIEVNEGWHNNPMEFQCLKLKHSSPCIGYRFKIENKIINYCVDTGYCDNAVELSKNADILISECSFASGQVNPAWPHLNPELATKLAKDAKAKKLVLTHFDANVYKTMKQRSGSEKIAKKIFEKTVAATDGKMINI